MPPARPYFPASMTTPTNDGFAPTGVGAPTGVERPFVLIDAEDRHARAVLIGHQHQRTCRIDREIAGAIDAARLVADKRHAPVIAEAIDDDAVVAAIRAVQKPPCAMHMDVCARGPHLVCRSRQGGKNLQLAQQPGLRVIRKRGHRQIELVDDVDEPAIGMKVEMTWSRACGSRDLRRHVRLHPPSGRIEDELRHSRAAFERHVHETVARIGANLMRHRSHTELSRIDGRTEPSIGADRNRGDRALLRLATVVRHQQPAARPVGRQMRGDAAGRRHIVQRRQRAARLVNRKRPDAARVGLVHGVQKFRRRIERQERRFQSNVRRPAGRHELAARRVEPEDRNLGSIARHIHKRHARLLRRRPAGGKREDEQDGENKGVSRHKSVGL